MVDVYIGTHFEIERKVLTIGAIETEILKAVREYKGKNILLTISKEIRDLCKMNIGYDERGFGVSKINVDFQLPECEFILTEISDAVHDAVHATDDGGKDEKKD